MQPSRSVSKIIDKEPIKRLAGAAGTCSTAAQAYGQCVLASYQDTRKGICDAEFALFKKCVQDVMKRKW